jgi:hypothetical protein
MAGDGTWGNDIRDPSFVPGSPLLYDLRRQGFPVMRSKLFDGVWLDMRRQ